MVKKRFYSENERVWVVQEKTDGIVKSIDKEKTEMTVEFKDVDGKWKEVTRKLWEFNKFHKKEEKETLKFAKIKEDAIIPSKREEDAGYDLYSNIEPRFLDGVAIYEQFLEKGAVNKIRTGIASSMSNKYFLSVKSERSSVAKLGINVLAGVIDSGYHGEIMVMVVPLVKDILITSEVDEVEEFDEIIHYPYNKAVAQGVLLPVPDVIVEEVTYDELLSKKTERGVGGFGSTEK